MTETIPSTVPGADLSLYERLGGAEGVRRLISGTVDRHLGNPRIAQRFQGKDIANAKEQAFRFFSMATGGPAIYDGPGLRAVHNGMNISEEEFVIACDDLLAAMTDAGIAGPEQQEVLMAFFMAKGDVLRI